MISSCMNKSTIHWLTEPQTRPLIQHVRANRRKKIAAFFRLSLSQFIYIYTFKSPIKNDRASKTNRLCHFWSSTKDTRDLFCLPLLSSFPSPRVAVRRQSFGQTTTKYSHIYGFDGKIHVLFRLTSRQRFPKPKPIKLDDVLVFHTE